MKTCVFCGARTEAASGFALCGGCRAQVGGLRADARGYGWYMKAVKRALFEEQSGSVGLSLPSRHQSFTDGNIRTEIFY